MGLFISILEGIRDTMIEMKNKAKEALLGKEGVEKTFE
jgi:hypothetical protein